MFFPFVGLALAVFWSLRLLWFRRASRLTGNRFARVGAIGGLCLVLAAEAAGTRRRNEVWRTEESLWRDVTLKSPRNGRGLRNYGLTLMGRGDFATALAYYDRALRYTPDYWVFETNLGIANAGLHRDAEAERHFRRAILLAPETAEPHYYYGRWLLGAGRNGEALRELETAVAKNRLAFDARDLLMQMYADAGNRPELVLLAQETLELAPANETARRSAAEAAKWEDTPESLVELSLKYYQAGRYTECVAAA